MKQVTSVLFLLFVVQALKAQNGYEQQSLKLPQSNEYKNYFVKKIGVNYVLNGDIIVGNTLQKTMLYQNNSSDGYLWPKGYIPVKVDENLKVTNWETKALYDVIMMGIQQINDQTRVKLKPYSGEKDFIFITYSPDTSYGGLSPVGKKGGEQVIYITKVGRSVRTVIHELLHSLGFWHEQNRWDRDQYISINLDNVDNEWKYAFQIEPGTTATPYDYFSIMHYSNYAFSKNGNIVIASKKDSRELLGGQWLSKSDIQGINAAYWYNDGLPNINFKSELENNFAKLAKQQKVKQLVPQQPVGNGLFKIKINQTGKYLAIEGISKDNGARLVQWDYVNQLNHQFYIRNIDGVYTIQAAHSHLYINVAGQAVMDGSPVIQWQYANQDNVKWKLVYVDKNEGSKSGWAIQGVQSGSYMSLQSFSGNNNGEALVIKSRGYGDGAQESVQTFTFEKIGELPMSEKGLYQHSPHMLPKSKSK